MDNGQVHDSDERPVEADRREYDFLHEDNITKDLFENLSGYQKVLLGTYATGDYSLKEISEMLGISACAINTNVHDASTALFNKIRKKFDGKMIKLYEHSEKFNMDQTLEAIGERNPSTFYHRVLEPQILAIAIDKGYVRPADNEEFRWLRQSHHSEIHRIKVANRIDDILEQVETAVKGTYASELPSLPALKKHLAQLKQEILEHKIQNGK